MSHDPRFARLSIEYTDLLNLAARSRFIKVEPVDVQPGWPPEKYIITYTCKGIARIDEGGAPIFSEFHQVSLYLGRDYPLREPYLKWLTPIWHPNIEHEEPRHVCTNYIQSWFSSKRLSNLVLIMGEMVQYKRYHAQWSPPYPIDEETARWVIDYAEPLGIITPEHPIDRRPLLRPQLMRSKQKLSDAPEASAGRGIKFGKVIRKGAEPDK